MSKKKTTTITVTTKIPKEAIEKYENGDDSAVIEVALKAKSEIEVKSAEHSIECLFEKNFKEEKR